MPITIVTPLQGTGFGPAVQYSGSSDFIGPYPTTYFWETTVNEMTSEAVVAGEQLLNAQPAGFQNDFQAGHQAQTFSSEVGVLDGTTVHLTVTLRDSATGNAIDQGAIQVQWMPSTNIGRLVDAHVGQGGLTTDQALQLEQTHAAVAPLVGLDALTLTDLTPGGPSSGPINANLTTPVFGIIVRLASIPPELVPQTPDGNYWLTTLAVVRVFRGSDLWFRVPIHTSDKIIPMTGEGVVTAVAEALTNLWLLNLSVQVDFLPGVTGTVFLMNFP